MALLQWDHTVHYVNDLEEAIKGFKDAGLVAFAGGSHKQWGTYNALSYFDLNYLEFLGVEDRALAESIVEPNDVVKDAVKLLPDQQVLSRVALRTDDIEKVAAELAAHNLTLSPIMDGKRLDAQGNLIQWRMMTIAGDFRGVPYPFIIQWKGSDEHRRKQLAESGIIQRHPAGEVEVERAVFSVEDPMAVANHWHDLFGFSIEGKPNMGVTLKAGKHSFVFEKGEENRLLKLVFSVDNQELKGKKIRIGQGEYEFV